MDGNSANKSEQSTHQQNEIDRIRVAALLRNAIQLITSGSVQTSQNQFDVATNPRPSSSVVNGDLPVGPELLQQHQSGPIGSTVPLPAYSPQVPFRHGESSHTAFYRCFPAARGLPNPGGRRRSSSSNRRLSSPYFIPQPTWTHEFFLLSRTTDCRTPERSQIDAMQKAGLGRCKITFQDKRGDHVHVKETLEKYYPKLASQNGAFQLLRCLSGGSGTRELTVIPMGVDGYPISMLKEVCRSSTIYIRPMQTNLSLEDACQQGVYSRYVATAKCMNCHLEVELSTFTDHATTCCKANNASGMCETSPDVNSHQIPSSHSIVQELQNIFPDRAIENLENAAAKSSDIHSAVDIVLNQEMELSPTAPGPTQLTASTQHKNEEVTTLQQLLYNFREESLSTQEIKISVDRDEIWRCGLVFYKKCINNPNRLKMSLEVNFTGLTGEQSSMDAGALSFEFFGALLKEASLRLLEGKEENLVPRRSGGNDTNFVVLGMLMGHSLLNGGPCIAVLAPWVYDMISGKVKFDDIATKITKEMIPLNAASSSTLQIIELLDKCTDNASINAILDTPLYLQIINSSQWDPTEVINMESKDRVITEIIYDELVLKRKDQISAIREGLAHVGFLKHIEEFPELCRPVFTGGTTPVSCAGFLALLDPVKTEDRIQEQVKSWFFDYVEHSTEETLSKLLRFSTAFQSIPPWGLSRKIAVKFLDDDDEKVFPEAMVCFHIIYLPTVHSSKVVFNMHLSQALECESLGFSSNT